MTTIPVTISNYFPAPGYKYSMTKTDYEPGDHISDGNTLEECVENYVQHLRDEGEENFTLEITGLSDSIELHEWLRKRDAKKIASTN